MDRLEYLRIKYTEQGLTEEEEKELEELYHEQEQWIANNI